MAENIIGARSLLFVPGDRPERFAKAEASGADGIVVDLEDAVAADNKDGARSHAATWFASGGAGLVRVNGVDTPWFAEDVAAIGDSGERTIMLPKASCDAVAAVVAAMGDGVRVVALVETAAGIVDAASICRAPNVIRVAFGSIDLSTEIGVDPEDHDALRYARSALVLASAAAGIAPPLDGVTTDVTSAQPAQSDALRAARLGFGGKLAIHPVQIAAVNTAFEPGVQDVAWAQRILATEGSGAVKVGGHMIDAPVLERARRIMGRAT